METSWVFFFPSQANSHLFSHLPKHQFNVGLWDGSHRARFESYQCLVISDDKACGHCFHQYHEHGTKVADP